MLSDKADIIQFQLAMALETENLKLDPTTLEKGVKAVFQDSHKGEYWVAYMADTVCGCLLTVCAMDSLCLCIARLYVEKSNTRAQKVYEKLGMSPDHYHLITCVHFV